MTEHTAQSVAAIVEAQIEPQTAEDVLAALKQLEGTPITTRLLDQLPGGRVEWKLCRELGAVEIRNRAYARNIGALDGMRLTIAEREPARVVASWIEAKNPEYFAHRRQRNALRARALQQIKALETVALIFNEVADLNHRREIAKAQFAVVVSPGEPLSADRVALARAGGLHDDD